MRIKVRPSLHEGDILSCVPSIQIQVVVHNSSDDLKECLEGVVAQTYPVTRILVIDNDSPDDAKSVVECFGNVDYIRLPKNVGYTGGHNFGFRQAMEHSIDYVLTLNPDVTLEPEYVSRAIHATHEISNCGGVTGKLIRKTLNSHSQNIVDSAGLYRRYFFHVGDRGSNDPDMGQFDMRTRVWGVCGAAAVYSTAMLKGIQYNGKVFDESFFLYKEDVDLCWRANRLGWQFVYEPLSVALHERTWKRMTDKVSRTALAHSFANQISLLIAHAHFSVELVLAILVEIARWFFMVARDPASGVTALRRVIANWNHSWRKRRGIRRQCINVEGK